MTEPGAGRDYAVLLRAVSDVLRVLGAEGGEAEALRLSFESAARGFGAQKALMLVVEEQEPMRLRAIETQGKLSAEQVRACERGESVKGVSPSVIRRVIESGRTELIPDPRLRPEAQRTASLQGANHSVLCAPVLDPLGDRVVAVLYFQNAELASAYEDTDRAWLEGYAMALGRVFGFHLTLARQQATLEELRQGIDPLADAPDILGDSADTQAMLRHLHEAYIPALAAATPDPILLLGEPGTGKDLVARYLHAYSARRKKPFVAVNCAELTEELAASRFFGHKRGAFTGALADEQGFFRAADGGVLFLDEIAELPPRAQACLLRVLENHTVVPVGETREIQVDVAVVLATNRDLEALVAQGVVRRDFYDRFRTQSVPLLPLRERPWDVPALLHHFRSHHERRNRKRTLGFTQEALRALTSYAWPGNVRELSRVCSLLVTHARAGARMDTDLLGRCYPELLRARPNPKAGPLLWDGLSLRDALRAVRKELIQARLERHGGNVRAARQSLALTKTTFHRYLRSLGIKITSNPR